MKFVSILGASLALTTTLQPQANAHDFAKDITNTAKGIEHSYTTNMWVINKDKKDVTHKQGIKNPVVIFQHGKLMVKVDGKLVKGRYKVTEMVDKRLFLTGYGLNPKTHTPMIYFTSIYSPVKGEKYTYRYRTLLTQPQSEDMTVVTGFAKLKLK